MLGVMALGGMGISSIKIFFTVKDGNPQVFSLKNIDSSRSIGLMIVMKESNTPNAQYS